MTGAYRPEDFAPEIAALEELPGQWAIFGGMAAIVWAERYLRPSEQNLEGLRWPLSSKVLDVRGRRGHAAIIRDVWGEGGNLQELRWKDTGRKTLGADLRPAWGSKSTCRGSDRTGAGSGAQRGLRVEN